MGRQGRKRLSLTRREGLRGRLKSLIGQGSKSRWGTRRELLEAAEKTGIEIASKTLSSWLDGKDPSVPDLPLIVALCEAFDISLNWLLLGEGPELLGSSRSSASLEDDLVERLVSDVAGHRKGAKKAVRYLLGKPADFYQRLRIHVADQARKKARRIRRDMDELRTLEQLDRHLTELNKAPRKPGWVPIVPTKGLARLARRTEARLDRIDQIEFDR